MDISLPKPANSPAKTFHSNTTDESEREGDEMDQSNKKQEKSLGKSPRPRRPN